MFEWGLQTLKRIKVRVVGGPGHYSVFFFLLALLEGRRWSAPTQVKNLCPGQKSQLSLTWHVNYSSSVAGISFQKLVAGVGGDFQCILSTQKVQLAHH